MQKINENLLVLSPGDPMEEIYNDMIKIYLTGTLDLNQNKIPWQQKFINALSRVTTSEPSEDMPDLRNLKFLVINPLSPTEGPMTLDNPGFTQKMQWELQNIEMADVIFCNYLKKGKAWSSLGNLLLNAKSGKVVARCPMDSEFYGYIKILGQTYGFPVVGDTASAMVIIKEMFTSIPKLADLINNGI